MAFPELIDLIGDARFVLLGEETHGTHEFYEQRAEFTRLLIAEHDFAAVAVEADWPDAYRVNAYVRHKGSDPDAEAALGSFERFPRWMWRNTVVRDLVAWLRDHNDGRTLERQAGFYGIDLYSLAGSIDAVLEYLDEHDPDAADRARRRYACFEEVGGRGGDPQQYGAAATYGTESCEDAVVQQLVELELRAIEAASGDGRLAEDAAFVATQNARLVRDAERYYRAMFRGREQSWNLRDTHMADTLDALSDYLSYRRGRPARIVVWAHNSHLGDARATEMSRRGELNVGQLMRQRHDGASFSVGFTTATGTVTAADEWDEPPRFKDVRPPLPSSVEALMHSTGAAALLVNLRTTEDGPVARALHTVLLERAIGVIYSPQTERQSHYFHARAADQFDALLHIDRTRALEPLDLV